MVLANNQKGGILMINDTNNLPTLKEIESNLFSELQDVFQATILSILDDIDVLLRDSRDFKRYENREKQKTTIATMFGSITINRRIYIDRYKEVRVALLDKYLEYIGSDSLSPFLTEMAVKWAVKGPSYRDSCDRFCDLLGYQVTSHETIRQEVLKIKPKEIASDEVTPKMEKDVLFLEVDGLNVHKQQSTRKSREIKFGVVHEGWEKRHPGSSEYKLLNKSYWETLGSGQEFWEEFSRYLYGKYEITNNTYVVINGDGAPWIRGGVDYFPNATYTYDRYHLKPWIERALSQRTKKEIRRAYRAADKNDPIALLTAISEAQKAETNEDKKIEISDLRQFILNNMDAFRDYRDILKEKDAGIDTSWMRSMGSAESNMNLFSRRLKKMGYSWSEQGLKGMLNGIIHRFEGTLIRAIENASNVVETDHNQIKDYPSFAPLLTERVRPSIGAIQGTMPALSTADQNKPYGLALRGLSGI